MDKKLCLLCSHSFNEIIRGYCRKCYYALKYKGELVNIDKPDITFLNKNEEDNLIGSMLGDGNLHRNKTSKYAHLKIERSNLDFKYLEYQYNILRKFCKSACKSYKRKDDKESCYFITRSYKILDDLYLKWYPNNIKTVPQDINLNSQIIAIWLADDGNISIHHKKHKLLRTNFATNGFSLNEVEMLANLLCNRYKETFKVNKTNIKNQYVINAADSASWAMINDIDNVFPDSMNRKSKVWRDLK